MRKLLVLAVMIVTSVQFSFAENSLKECEENETQEIVREVR